MDSKVMEGIRVIVDSMNPDNAECDGALPPSAGCRQELDGNKPAGSQSQVDLVQDQGRDVVNLNYRYKYIKATMSFNSSHLPSSEALNSSTN